MDVIGPERAAPRGVLVAQAGDFLAFDGDAAAGRLGGIAEGWEVEAGAEGIVLVGAGDGCVFEEAGVRDVETRAVGRKSKAKRVGPGFDRGDALHRCRVDDHDAPVALIESVDGFSVGGEDECRGKTAGVVFVRLSDHRGRARQRASSRRRGRRESCRSRRSRRRAEIRRASRRDRRGSRSQDRSLRQPACAGQYGVGLRGIGDDIQRERKSDGRDSDLCAIGTHREREGIGREGDPIAGGMNLAAIGQDGGDTGLRGARQQEGGKEKKRESVATNHL